MPRTPGQSNPTFLRRGARRERGRREQFIRDEKRTEAVVMRKEKSEGGHIIYIS